MPDTQDNTGIKAEVSAPTPIPPRPTIHLILTPTRRDWNRTLAEGFATQQERDAALVDALPGSVGVTIPGEPAPSKGESPKDTPASPSPEPSPQAGGETAALVKKCRDEGGRNYGPIYMRRCLNEAADALERLQRERDQALGEPVWSGERDRAAAWDSVCKVVSERAHEWNDAQPEPARTGEKVVCGYLRACLADIDRLTAELSKVREELAAALSRAPKPPDADTPDANAKQQGERVKLPGRAAWEEECHCGHPRGRHLGDGYCEVTHQRIDGKTYSCGCTCFRPKLPDANAPSSPPPKD